MPYEIDETHDPNLESWVESANDPSTDFPIQNLPFALLRVASDEHEGAWHDEVVTRIGDRVVNLSLCARAGAIEIEHAFAEDLEVYIGDGGVLNSLGDDDATPGFRGALRRAVSRLLSRDNRRLRDDAALRAAAVIEADACDPMPPTVPHDYTDFYASVHHATNVGSMFRPDNPLLPNYKWLPVGYHGRASSVVESGTDIVRPRGQTITGDVGLEGRPTFGPCTMLDYELEMAVVVGRGNELGSAIPIDRAEEHMLGLCLLNDWSARDMQKWEYQPLGPFLAKNFATTVSPYVVTMEALAPFRAPRYERPAGDPQPLPHLDGARDRAAGAFDVTLEVFITTEQMRQRGMAPQRLSKANFKDMYWTPAQMLTHHASNGCNMQPGDLIGSGTVSGPTRGSRGCLLELTWDGDPWATPPVIKPGSARTPIRLPSGETRTFLADGDEVVIRGCCEREGFRRIGFGECRGIVRPARG